MRTFRTSGERKTLKDTLPAVLIVLASLLAASGPVWAQTPMSTAFSYQGQIKERGEPVTDAGDFVFQLWDAPIDGRLLATDSIPNVPIADGLFTAQIAQTRVWRLAPLRRRLAMADQVNQSHWRALNFVL